jgi:hypothetical protein
MTLSIMTLSTIKFSITINKTRQNNSIMAEHCYAKSPFMVSITYAECHIYVLYARMLSVTYTSFMLSVVMLNVIMLNVVILIVMPPTLPSNIRSARKSLTNTKDKLSSLFQHTCYFETICQS